MTKSDLQLLVDSQTKVIEGLMKGFDNFSASMEKSRKVMRAMAEMIYSEHGCLHNEECPEGKAIDIIPALKHDCGQCWINHFTEEVGKL